MSEDNFKWNENSVDEFLYELSSLDKTSWVHSQLCKWKDEFKASKTKAKDYEILECYNEVFGLHDFVDEKESTTPCLKLEKPCKIHSVKRLVDSEIFSIGDETSNGNIHSFEIRDYGLGVVFYSGNMGCAIPLNAVQKVKQPIPLFTTEDGKEIFEGDEYCIVLTEDGFGFEPYTVAFYTKGDIAKVNCYGKCKTFSTREKANEYILLNKPCLSVNELIVECGKRDFVGVSFLKEKLKEVVKSKIDKQ